MPDYLTLTEAEVFTLVVYQMHGYLTNAMLKVICYLIAVENKNLFYEYSIRDIAEKIGVSKDVVYKTLGLIINSLMTR